jgi:hypothetical protein
LKGGLVPSGSGAWKVLSVIDTLGRIKLFDESIDRLLVLRRLLRHPSSLDIADGFRFHAGLLGHRRVHEPLILRLPVVCGAQDGKFRQPRLDAGLETQMAAELLGKFAECRRMQIDREWTGHLELAARP